MVREVTPLEEARRRKNLAQYDVCRLTGIYQSRLSALERGHVKPRPAEIEALQRVLGRDVFEEEEVSHGE